MNVIVGLVNGESEICRYSIRRRVMTIEASGGNSIINYKYIKMGKVK